MNRRSRPQWSTLGFIGVLALIVVSALPFLQSISSALAAGTISGTVFQDYNANGIKDTGNYTCSMVPAVAIDQGIGSVIVSAFDSTGLVGTTTTAAK